MALWEADGEADPFFFTIICEIDTSTLKSGPKGGPSESESEMRGVLCHEGIKNSVGNGVGDDGTVIPYTDDLVGR